MPQIRVPFTKMEGLGNDYIYVDPRETGELDWGRLARAISDRHFGVGGDGLILVRQDRAGDPRMEMYNADGSEGEMCGNGIRCVAIYLHRRGRMDAEATIQTKAGPIRVAIEDENTGRVRVDMGRPRLSPGDIPTTLGGGEVALPGVDLTGIAVSMGNPHFVTFWADVESAPVTTLGPAVEHHHAFPNRTNVEFAQVTSEGSIRLRVWERGTGETMACGTGASATVVAAVTTGRTSRHVRVTLAGGDLDVAWEDHVTITGPCREVFAGTYTWPEGDRKA